jgi:hypothetical protein
MRPALGVPRIVRDDALLIWLAERANVAARHEDGMSRGVATSDDRSVDVAADDEIGSVDEVFAGL